MYPFLSKFLLPLDCWLIAFYLDSCYSAQTGSLPPLRPRQEPFLCCGLISCVHFPD